MPESPARQILLASGNPGKISELRLLLRGLPLQLVAPAAAGLRLPAVNEDGKTFVANATKKALATASFWEGAALADDSGLEVDALDGAPGVLSARFAGVTGPGARQDEANNALLLKRLRDVPLHRRGARFVCVLVLALPGRVLVAARGEVEGQILEAPRGSGGFGYDPLFLHPPSGLTFAEMDAAAKHTVSHRGRAGRELRRLLAAGGTDSWW